MRNQGSADRLESMRNQYGARPVRHRSRSRSRSQSVGEEEIELDRGAAWTPESPAAKDAPAAEWYLRTALEKGQLPLQTPDGDLAFPEPGDSTKQPIDQEAVESFAEAVVFSASRGLERDLDELFRTAVQAAGEWPRPGTFKERVVRAFFAQFMISTSDDFMRAFDVDSLSAGADSTDTAAFYHATATKRRFLEGKMALESARYRTSISELDGFRARVERDWGKSGPLAARLLPAMMRDLLHRAIAVSGDPARRSKLKDPVGAVHAILRQGWQIYTWFPNAFVDVLKKPEFVVAWDRNAKRGGRWGKEEVEVVVNVSLWCFVRVQRERLTRRRRS